MSKISDELRAAANRLFLSGSDGYGTIMGLAVLIDEDMVELPRDKDGEPIHLGDTVYDKDGLAWHVRGVTLTYDAASTSNCVIRAGSEKGNIRGLNPEMLTNKRTDSLERIAEELDEMKERFRTSDSDTFFALQDLAGRVYTQAEERAK